MSRLRTTLLVVLLIYPLIVGALTIVIRDNTGGRTIYTVDAVVIDSGIVTGMPDRIFAAGF